MASVIRGDDNFDSSSVGPSTTLGAVGTYAFVHRGSSNLPGTTVAGSLLQYANTADANNWGGCGVVPSGTWRLMGSTGYFGGAYTTTDPSFRMTVAVRIS